MISGMPQLCIHFRVLLTLLDLRTHNPTWQVNLSIRFNRLQYNMVRLAGAGDKNVEKLG